MPFIDLLFPKFCVGCKREGTHCCQDCFSLLSLARTPSALKTPSHLSALFCATSFEDTLARRLIHSFKYPPFLSDLAHPLAFSIIAHFSLLNKFNFPLEAIVPVPLHKKRLKWRGYNHAEKLAERLEEAFSIPMIPNVLEKTKHTNPQANLNKQQRLSNVQGAFSAANPQAIQGNMVLLVDDVYTTGATMEECARVLKEAGAVQIIGAAVARG